MHADDYRVTSELYRLMPSRKHAAGNGDAGEALDAARASGSAREALDAACGTAPEPAAPAGEFAWPDAALAGQRHWSWRLGRVLARVDVWILIATVAGVIIAYLTLVKPR
jgi:hypothetical protein